MKIIKNILTLLTSKSTATQTPKAKRGTFEVIESQLQLLKVDRDPVAFFGFCTKDEDSLYFVYQNGRFNLDYELYTPEKLKLENSFRQVAKMQGYDVLNTSYDNQHVVLRIELSSLESEASEQAFKFAHELFGIERSTVLEFLP